MIASTHSTVTIIGAGITGIGAACHFGKNNISYVVLEAREDVS